MKSHYDKQPIPVGEQINILESKGMEFYDRAFATRILSIIGYFRFSGYAYPFRNEVDNSGFNDDTSFERFIQSMSLTVLLNPYSFPISAVLR